jgi:hypothetical protein
VTCLEPKRTQRGASPKRVLVRWVAVASSSVLVVGAPMASAATRQELPVPAVHGAPGTTRELASFP